MSRVHRGSQARAGAAHPLTPSGAEVVGLAARADCGPVVGLDRVVDLKDVAPGSPGVTLVTCSVRSPTSSHCSASAACGVEHSVRERTWRAGPEASKGDVVVGSLRAGARRGETVGVGCVGRDVRQLRRGHSLG